MVVAEGSILAQCKTLCKVKGRHGPHIQVLMAKDEKREKTAHSTNLRQSERRDIRVAQVLM